MSAAIVSGIVALVLAFVHKEKGPNARAKISNNPVMKGILGKMATKRGQHNKVFGYGSLKPLKVFGYGVHILWSVIENLPSILVAGSNDDEPCKCLDAKLTHNDNSDTDHYTYYYKSSNDLELPDDLPKVTVAILGNTVNTEHKQIKKIIPDDNFKCFTVPPGGTCFPPGGTCEKDRDLGTPCASIIASDVDGISPFVDLVYATVINAEAQTKPEWVISALEWIEREHANADIVVIPLGFDTFNLGLFKIINKLSKNMIVVCAASNPRKLLMQEICYPAIYGDVICVGSHQDNSSQPSSCSPRGRELDLLVVEECVGSLSGTCVAAAYVTGVVAQVVAFAFKCGFGRQESPTIRS